MFPAAYPVPQGTSEALSTSMRVTSEGTEGCTNPSHSSTISAKEHLTVKNNDSTSSPAVTALPHCVYNLEHMYFSQDYNCVHYCTENALSQTFIYWNISNSPMIINMGVSKECCNYHSERLHGFFDPSIQPSATTRIWCFREKRETALPLPTTAY